MSLSLFVLFACLLCKDNVKNANIKYGKEEILAFFIQYSLFLNESRGYFILMGRRKILQNIVMKEMEHSYNGC